MRPIAVTSGEPAGIGPDICLSLSQSSIPLVVFADKNLLKARAQQLSLDLELLDYSEKECFESKPNALVVYHIPCAVPVNPTRPKKANAPYVLSLLKNAVEGSLSQKFSAVVTAPIHKETINAANIPFTGHTEFLAEACSCKNVV